MCLGHAFLSAWLRTTAPHLGCRQLLTGRHQRQHFKSPRSSRDRQSGHDPGADTPSPKRKDSQPTDRRRVLWIDPHTRIHTHTHTQRDRETPNVNSSERQSLFWRFPDQDSQVGRLPTYIVVGRRQPPSLAGFPGQVARSPQPIPTLPRLVASMALQEPPGIPYPPRRRASHPYPTPLDRRIQERRTQGRENRSSAARAAPRARSVAQQASRSVVSRPV